jgi:hypothetical protein
MKKTIHFLICIYALLFVTMFFLIALNNCFAADDFYSIGTIRQNGVLYFLNEVYSNWNFRLMPLLIASLIFKFSDFYFLPFIISLVGFALFVFSSYLLLKTVILNYLKANKRKNEILVITIAFTSAFFFNCYSINETWFWVSASVTYLWSICFFNFALFIFISKNHKAIHYLLLAFSAFYIGSASEPFAIQILILSSFLLCFNFNFVITQKALRNKCAVFLFFLIAALLLAYFAPGRTVRQSYFMSGTAVNAVLMCCRALIKMILYLLVHSSPYLIVTLILFALLGYYLADEKKIKLRKYFSIKKSCFYLFLFSMAIFIGIFPMAYVMQDLAFNRTLTHISYLLNCFICFLAFIVGIKIENRFLMNKNFESIFCFVAITLLLIRGVSEFSIAKRYHVAFSSRIKNLKNLNSLETSKVVNLEPLPESGWIHSAELSSDYNYDQNYFFKNALNLKFEIQVKTENN